MTQEINVGGDDGTTSIEPRDEYCGCGLKNGARGATPNCGYAHYRPDGTTIICTRPDGHDGPHAGCSPSEHPMEAWR